MEGCESPSEFVRDSGAAEFSEGVGGVWSSWMDDGEGIGYVVHLSGWVVMVGDDEIDTEFFGFGCWSDGGNAAVDGDDDFGTGIGECFDRGFVEAVAFVDAVGDVGGDLGVWRDDSEHVDEDRGGGDAVDIVISEYDDGFVVGDRFEDSGRGFVEVGDHGRIVESGEGGGEEGLGSVLVGEVTRGEDAVNEREGGFGEGFGGVPVSCEASGWGGCRSGLLDLGRHSWLRGHSWKDTL